MCYAFGEKGSLGSRTIAGIKAGIEKRKSFAHPEKIRIFISGLVPIPGGPPEFTQEELAYGWIKLYEPDLVGLLPPTEDTPNNRTDDKETQGNAREIMDKIFQYHLDVVYVVDPYPHSIRLSIALEWMRKMAHSNVRFVYVNDIPVDNSNNAQFVTKLGAGYFVYEMLNIIRQTLWFWLNHKRLVKHFQEMTVRFGA